VESRGSQVRIHYIGFSSSADKWQEETDLVSLTPTEPILMNTQTDNTYKPYNLYSELGIKIKQALLCGRKQSPVVTITMGFDALLFKGGLEAAGILKQTVRGHQQCQLQCYSDLDSLLGRNWHYRGINNQGDYANAVLKSIEYYLVKQRSIAEYHPDQSNPNDITVHKIDGGYNLKFSFVRGYGNKSTFGRNKDIFG